VTAFNFHPIFSLIPSHLEHQTHTSMSSNATTHRIAPSPQFHITNLQLPVSSLAILCRTDRRRSAGQRSESSLSGRRTNDTPRASGVPAGMRQSVTLTLSLVPKRTAGGGCTRHHHICSLFPFVYLLPHILYIYN